MDHDLARQALRVFEQAMEVDAASRGHFLDQACAGNPALRAEVDSLLDTWEDDSCAEMADHGHSSARVALGSLLAERYRIEEVLGAGGMGEVYRARDTRLDRDVAVKILHQTGRQNQSLRQRFEREIKAVASLSHPNIVTLFDTSAHADTDVAVMEFIDGQTLRTRMRTPLDWKSATRYALGIARALKAAHAHGVIHRDVKPDNVMIDAHGAVKVLDFGLAKPVDALNQDGLTTGAATPGTVPYMSPEQTNGLPLDGATDVFSLGTTLFEMLSGKNPFRDRTAFATMQNINAAAPRLASSAVDAPEKLVTLVEDMLLRAPAERPSASEVVRSLDMLLDREADVRPTIVVSTESPANAVIADTQGLDSTAMQSGRPSIAVLPLQSFSADPSHSFLGDAIAQEVIIELARLHWLFVIARGSSFQFREPSVDIAEVGAALGARYVLTGSVEMVGQRGAVSVELMQARNQRVVWAERFQVTIDELLRLRHNIASSIVVAIESRIQISEAESAQRIPTESLDAWSAYHRGLWHMYRFNREDNVTAASLFQHAIEQDVRFARAYAGLSFTHFQEAFLRFSTDEQSHRDQALSFAEKSLELDPLDPFTNLTMGRAAWLADDLDDAGSWFSRSLELSPNFAFAWYNQSLTNVLRNDGVQAEHGAAKAMSLSPIDPLSYAMYSTLALSHIVRGEYEDAVPWVAKAIREPTAHVHIWLIAALAHQLAGRRTEAAQFAATIKKRSPKYSQDQFFKVFPFRDPDTLGLCQNALKQIGL